MSGYRVADDGVTIVSPSLAQLVRVALGLLVERRRRDGFVDRVNGDLVALAEHLGDWAALRPPAEIRSEIADRVARHAAEDEVPLEVPRNTCVGQCGAMTVGLSASALGVSESYVRRLARAGRLPAHEGRDGWHIDDSEELRAMIERKSA